MEKKIKLTTCSDFYYYLKDNNIYDSEGKIRDLGILGEFDFELYEEKPKLKKPKYLMKTVVYKKNTKIFHVVGYYNSANEKYIFDIFKLTEKELEEDFYIEGRDF